MAKRIEISTGDRFGKLSVLAQAQHTDRKNRYFECSCDCGGRTVASVIHLRSGHTSSCGCVRYERLRASKKNKKHGQARNKNKKGTSEYTIWQGMKSRCTDENNKRWQDYGGRGIKVCDEWINSFSAFFAHVGKRPSKDHSLDRINNDGNYEPGNVRWATRSQQVKNRRSYAQPNRTLKNAMRRASKATQQGTP